MNDITTQALALELVDTIKEWFVELYSHLTR